MRTSILNPQSLSRARRGPRRGAPRRFALPVPDDFNFLTAVCSHGFFVLAPNLWDPDRRTLHTVVTVDDHTAVPVAITEVVSANPREPIRPRTGSSSTGSSPSPACEPVRPRTGSSATASIRIACPVPLSKPHRALVRAAVRRMLRLDEDLAPFHQRCRDSSTHRRAAATRFGRLLRSPSLFEDVVKVICTCNTAWPQTVAMIERIVAHWGVPCAITACPKTGVGPASSAVGPASSRSICRVLGQALTVHPRTRVAPASRRCDSRVLGCTLNQTHGFPTPQRLARLRVSTLRAQARVGYRAEFIHRLARDVADGRLDLHALERFPGPSDDLYRLLRRIHGVGDYAAAHLCMLLGRYDRLAIDTELKRFLHQRHPRRRLTPARLRSAYDQWHPYQFLAYWFDLWQDYTRRHGHSHLWTPAGIGRRITL